MHEYIVTFWTGAQVFVQNVLSSDRTIALEAYVDDVTNFVSLLNSIFAKLPELCDFVSTAWTNVVSVGPLLYTLETELVRASIERSLFVR